MWIERGKRPKGVWAPYYIPIVQCQYSNEEIHTAGGKRYRVYDSWKYYIHHVMARQLRRIPRGALRALGGESCGYFFFCLFMEPEIWPGPNYICICGWKGGRKQTISTKYKRNYRNVVPSYAGGSKHQSDTSLQEPISYHRAIVLSQGLPYPPPPPFL